MAVTDSFGRSLVGMMMTARRMRGCVAALSGRRRSGRRSGAGLCGAPLAFGAILNRDLCLVLKLVDAISDGKIAIGQSAQDHGVIGFGVTDRHLAHFDGFVRL